MLKLGGLSVSEHLIHIHNQTPLWPSNKHCVVPENIHTPPRKGLEFPGGWGGSKAQENPEGWGGVLYQFILFFPDRFHYFYMLNFLFAFCLPIRGRKH